MSRINHHLPNGIKAVKVIGLSGRPSEDIVNGTFECVQVIEKLDRNGNRRVWVPLVLFGILLFIALLFHIDIMPYTTSGWTPASSTKKKVSTGASTFALFLTPALTPVLLSDLCHPSS